MELLQKFETWYMCHKNGISEFNIKLCDAEKPALNINNKIYNYEVYEKKILLWKENSENAITGIISYFTSRILHYQEFKDNNLIFQCLLY